MMIKPLQRSDLWKVLNHSLPIFGKLPFAVPLMGAALVLWVHTWHSFIHGGFYGEYQAGELLGFVCRERNKILILVTLPGFRGSGIAGKLLAHAETEIKNAGYSTVQLQSCPEAAQFYLEKGYHPASLFVPMEKQLK